MFELFNINKKFFIANREKNKPDDIVMEADSGSDATLYINRKMRLNGDLDLGKKLYAHGSIELTDDFGKLNYKNLSSIGSIPSGLIGYNDKEWNICSPQQSETLYSKNFSTNIEEIDINDIKFISSYIDKNNSIYFSFPISSIINFNSLSFKLFWVNHLNIQGHYYLKIKFGSVFNLIDEISIDIYDEIKNSSGVIDNLSFPIMLPLNKFKDELFYLKLERDFSPNKGDTFEDKLFIPFINLTYQTNFFRTNNR